MMLTVEEYMFLRSMMDSSAGQDIGSQEPGRILSKEKTRRRRKSAYSKAMSKELKILNTKYKTKKGDYRKGFDQGRIMKMAHKNVRRMMK